MQVSCLLENRSRQRHCDRLGNCTKNVCPLAPKILGPQIYLPGVTCAIFLFEGSIIL